MNKALPNDKQELLNQENYEIYNRDLIRRVFPRIITEAHEKVFKDMKKKPEIRDIVYFYFLLQAYIDGRAEKPDGTASDRFGACFLSYDAITKHMRTDRKRVLYLAGILETNGIIRIKRGYDKKRFNWYFPSFCPRISEDGYIIDEFGEKVVPDFSKYLPPSRQEKTEQDAA